MVSSDIAQRPVPASPLWTVHDVIGHLAGITEDAVTGNMQGATTDPWTAAQVERGRTKSLDDLLTMWGQYGPFIEARLSSPEGAPLFRAVFDIHAHECDLLTALGRPVSLPADVAAWAGGLLRSGFHEAVRTAGLGPVTVDVSDVEVFRSRLGRRTAQEASAYRWSADPAPYLPLWFVFGPAEQSIGESLLDVVA